jgi:hypothetical protein
MLKQIRWTALTLAGLAGTFSVLADSANAQGTTTQSSFGTRTLGGSASSNRTGQGSTSGTNSTNGQGGTGTGTMAGALGTGAPTGERYVRGNRNGAFVGSDTGDGASNSYSQQAGGAGGLGGAMGNQMMMQAFRQSQQQNQAGKQQQTKLAVRTPFRVDFMAQPQLTTTFTARMQTRYLNLPALKGKGSIEPVLEGDTLVLRGRVESAADRKLVEDLLSLEPGVNQVRNELEIVQSASAPVPVSVESPVSAEPLAPKRVSRPVER